MLAAYLEGIYGLYENEVGHALRRGEMTVTPEGQAQIDADFLCPIVRGIRFYAAQCNLDGSGAPGCGFEYMSPTVLEPLVDEAQDRGICAREFTAPLEELIFAPERPWWISDKS